MPIRMKAYANEAKTVKKQLPVLLPSSRTQFTIPVLVALVGVP